MPVLGGMLSHATQPTHLTTVRAACDFAGVHSGACMTFALGARLGYLVLVASLNSLFGFALRVPVVPCYTGLDCKGGCMFSDFAIWYLFLAGTAAGAFLWAAVIDIRGAYAFAQNSVPFRSRTGFHGCTMLLAFAALMLFLDLGNPYDILYLFENPLRSVMSVGAWLLTLCLAVSVAVSVLLLLGRSATVLFRVLELAGLVFGAGVMTYTGVLLSSMVSIDFWNTPWLVLLFVASAVSCGAALVEALSFVLVGSSRGLRDLARAAGTSRAVEFAALAVFLLSRWFAGGAAQSSCATLFAGDLAGLFWGGLVLCGFAAPLACDMANRLVRVPVLRLAGAVSTLAGGVCLRYCVVLAAAYSAITVNVT